VRKKDTLPRLGGFIGFEQADRLAQVIEWLDEAGFGTVQPGNVPGFLDETDKKYTKILDRALAASRLKPGGFHMCFVGLFLHERWDPTGSHYNWCSPDPTIREEAVGRYIRAAEVAIELGFKRLVTHISDAHWWPCGEPRRRMREFAIEGLKRVADPVKKWGGMIAVENCGFDFDSSVEGIRSVIDEVGDDVVGVCLDTGHAHIAYHSGVAEEPATVIRSLKGRILSTHIHDNDGTADQHLMPGSGMLDWAEIERAFADSGYEGPFEYETKPAELEGLDALLAIRGNFKRTFPSATQTM